MTLAMKGLSPDLATTLKDISKDRNLGRLLEYFPSSGRLVDREAGAEWIKRYNLEASAEDIAVTVGGQNSLAVVLSAMFRPGDTVAVEGITYPLIKTLSRRFHLKLAAVEQDEFGMMPESLDEVCRNQSGVSISCPPVRIRQPLECRSIDGRPSRKLRGNAVW